MSTWVLLLENILSNVMVYWTYSTSGLQRHLQQSAVSEELLFDKRMSEQSGAVREMQHCFTAALTFKV